MPSRHALGRAYDGILKFSGGVAGGGVVVSLMELLKQGGDNGTLPRGVSAIYDAVSTRGSLRLLWCQRSHLRQEAHLSSDPLRFFRLTSIRVARARIWGWRQGNLSSRIDKTNSSGS